MTGRYPPGHGSRHNGMQVDDKRSDARQGPLRRRLYTGAFVSAFPLDRRFGLNDGFAAYNDKMPRRAARAPRTSAPAA